MTRLIIFLIVVTLFSMLAVWIAEQPGDISLIWQGYLIEGPVSVLIGLIAALSVLLASVLWFLAVVLRLSLIHI